MANQVRPGLTNPVWFNGPNESAAFLRRQPAHSIRARGHSAVYRGRMYDCNLYLGRTALKKRLGTKGASMYEPWWTPCRVTDLLASLRSMVSVITGSGVRHGRIARAMAK
jgi:hypothetical protein